MWRDYTKEVSTHSRPKAAGLFILYCYFLFIVSTHSRPKAAGIGRGNADRLPRRFNTQPPEGGWPSWVVVVRTQKVFQHTAARRRLGLNLKPIWFSEIVSTHSRPKAAGSKPRRKPTGKRCFNTQPPEGGWIEQAKQSREKEKFQHTAARRRLGGRNGWDCGF